MSFLLKKFLGSLLLPLPFLLVIMLIALILLWFSHWQKTARILLSLSWLCLLLLSLQPVADRLLLPLESQYPVWRKEKPVDYIVVLGGGYTWNPDWSPASNLPGNSLPRVAEGVRLWLQQPTAKLVFTGGAAADNPLSSAEVAAQVAISLGVPASAIVALTQPHDTHEEAEVVKQLVGQRPFLLVTSANHMPRAMNFFHQQGLSPYAAPANQLAITSPLNLWEQWFPAAMWLSHSERAWYETLGRVWQWINQPAAAGQPDPIPHSE